jgi:hypothetical protein
MMIAGVVSTGGVTALTAKLLKSRSKEKGKSIQEPKQKEK